MSDNNKVVHRTNTAQSLTTRESGILLNLLAKLHASPAPAGQKLDRGATSRAFGVVASFVDASLVEARENLKELRKAAAVKNADEAVVNAASQAETSLKRMEGFYKSANLGEIKSLADRAKAEAERDAARKAERASRAVAKDTTKAVSKKASPSKNAPAAATSAAAAAPAEQTQPSTV